MQRFQVPYNLKEIPEVQEYLNGAFENAKHHGDLQDLYRRSLLVEPKQPADTPPGPPANDMRQLFSWATRSQAQQPSPTTYYLPGWSLFHHWTLLGLSVATLHFELFSNSVTSLFSISSHFSPIYSITLHLFAVCLFVRNTIGTSR